LGAAALGAVAWLSLGKPQGSFGEGYNEQYRDAVSYAIGNAQPGDGWVFVSKWSQFAFEYYAGWHWGRNPAAPYGDIYEPFDWGGPLRFPRYGRTISLAGLERFAATHQRIWLVLSHERRRAEGTDASAPVRDWLTTHGFTASQQGFRHVRVELYQRPG
jgi:hypothetical protein